MDKLTNLVSELKKAIDTSNKKTSPYDTTAVVRRVDADNRTLWVHIPGGVDETPVKMSINAEVGDNVNIRVSGGTAWVVGNETAPPTDDRTAIIARKAATTAHAAAKTAEETAITAQTTATGAQESADEAQETANTAWAYAGTAAQAAEEAQASADSARESAIVANNAANNALTQLSVVEDVAGTLSWIQEHGSYVATTDTTVNTEKIYFEFVDGDYVPIANPDPTANPSTEGWYVLDVSDSQAQYIMAHLAVTSAGLWVLPVNGMGGHPLVDSEGNEIVDSNGNVLSDWRYDPQNASGYKVLLSGTGMIVFNGEGAAVARYGETTTIGEASGKHVFIDNDSVDIIDGDAVLATFGSTMRVGPSQNANDVWLDVLPDENRFCLKQNLQKSDLTLIDYSLFHVYGKGFLDSNDDIWGNTWFTLMGSDVFIVAKNAQDNTPYLTIGQEDDPESEREAVVTIFGDVCTIDTNQVAINGDLGINGRKYGYNEVLWTHPNGISNGWYMSASQTVTLANNISTQPNGIVLVWSSYANSAANNYDWYHHFIPKWQVSNFNGTGVAIPICLASTAGNGTAWAAKYVYVHNDKIVGYSGNSQGNAANFVLRAVLGV